MTDATIPMFVQFGRSHLVAMAVIVLGLAIIPLMTRRASARQRLIIDKLLAVVIVGTEVVRQILWVVVFEVWSLDAALPLHLCGLSVFVLAGALWTHDRRLFEIGYFWGLAGSINAILTPEIWVGWPHFGFSAFFFSHAVLILAPLHLVATTGLRPTLAGLHKTFGFTLIVTAAIGGINIILGSNYMFLCWPPEGKNIIALYLSPWPWYILQLAVIALLNFYIVYLPFGIAAYRRNRAIPMEARLQ